MTNPSVANAFSVLGLTASILLGCSHGESTDQSSGQDLSAAKPSNDLTPAQVTAVLNRIDDHCSDAWCESDLDYSFDSMVCTFGTGECTMGFVATDKEKHTKHPLSCTLSGIKTFSEMIETFPNGFQDLTTTLFDKIDKCVTEKSTGL
jgi:hypothetical protein